MSLRLRLNLVFLAMAGVALGLGWYGLQSVRLTREAVEHSGQREQRLADVHAIELAFHRGVQAAQSFVGGDPVALERSGEIIREVEQRLIALTDSQLVEEERQIVAGLSLALGGYQRTLERAMFCLKNAQEELTLPLLDHLDRALLPDVSSEVDRLVAIVRDEARRAEEQARGRSRQASAVVLAALLSLAIGAAALYIILRRWLLDPLEQLSEGARRISKGEYDVPMCESSAAEFRTLAAEFATMGESIEGYQRALLEKERLAALGEMTHAVAHNVRNPLASIRALAQSAERSLDDDSAELRRALRSIMKSVDGLDRWIKDLLVSLRPIRLTRTTVDLHQVVREVAESMSTYANQCDVSIAVVHSTEPCEASIDRRRLDQALISVVSNAIEASPPKSQIRVSCLRLPDPDSAVEIVISDQGPGIPVDDQQKIFTPYYSTKPHGTGLGLSLAQRIVISHQGRLEVESEPGKGSRFRLVIPPSVAQEASP